MRVRLLGRTGLPGAPARGVPRRARQLEPGDDHDRPRVGGRDLPRAARRRDGRRGDRARAARRDPADTRRPDGAEPGGRARPARDRADRRRPGGDQPRRGPRALPVDGAFRRAADAAQHRRAHTRGGLPRARDRPAGVHARRHRGRRRLDAGAAARDDRARACDEPRRAGAGRGVSRGLAGARARGDVRRARQRRRRLLDREPRPDGRPHGRLLDDRAPADPSGPGLPGPARGGLRRPRAPSASRRAGRTSSSPSIPPARSSG